jgi:drug/metabolite transporter (DMT)-like permease
VMVLANGSHIPSLDPVMPENLDWLWLFGVGAASAFAHMLMTYALRYAPSATLAPLHYLEIISASVMAYLVFGDFPNALTWAGIGIIAASGLYIIHRERITARAGKLVHSAVAPGTAGP